MANKNKSNELLDVAPKRRTNELFMLNSANDNNNNHKKPQIQKPTFDSRDLRSKLDSFLPKLKAANDSLPEDISTLDIENVGDGDEQYIEMDLGLGVLEEKRDESDSERDDDEGDEGETTTRDLMGKLMNQSGQLTRPGIITETETTTGAESGLLCDDRLVRYRTLCHPALRYEMDIVISLMSRILIQLRRHRAVKDVATITKMNVLKEDMYKLMSRRDRLLLDHHEPDRLKHEALYLDELDDLI